MNLFGKRHALIFLAGAALSAAAGAATDIVPLTFINGLPFTTVKVGAASSLVMIDTGGALGISMPQASVVQSGAVTLLDRKTKFHDLNGAVFEVQDLLARQVVVGATLLGTVEGRIHTQWGGAPEGPQAELTKARQTGAIGLSAFGDRPLMFDYRQRTMAIHAPGEGPQEGRQGWQALRLAYGKEGPYITLLVHGKPLKFVLDTGSPVNLVNAASLGSGEAELDCEKTPAAGAQCDPRQLGQVNDSDGKRVGDLTAERVKLEGAPFDGLLGAPFFLAHRVVFDVAAHRLLIAPPSVQ